MRPRDSLLLDTYNLADSETKIIDINVKQPITAIQVMYYAKNGSESCISNWLHENITKIELVDGSEVLWSLNAAEAQGLAFYGHGIEARDYLREGPDARQYCDIWMMFGRFMYDQVYAFDPAKHKNPQLKLTHNIETIASIAATSYATGEVNVRVLARMMEEIPPPKGFLMAKQHISYDTGSSSSTEYIDLPTDHPYRMIAMRVHVENKQGHEVLQNVKLNIDQENYVPFELTGSDLANFGLELRGYAKVGYFLRAKHNSTHDLIAFNGGRHGQALTGGHYSVIYTPHGGGNRITVSAYDASASAAYDTAADLFFIQRGTCYQDLMVYPFGRIDEPEDWLKVAVFGSIRLEAQTEGWSAAASLVLQQEKLYA